MDYFQIINIYAYILIVHASFAQYVSNKATTLKPLPVTKFTPPTVHFRNMKAQRFVIGAMFPGNDNTVTNYVGSTLSNIGSKPFLNGSPYSLPGKPVASSHSKPNRKPKPAATNKPKPPAAGANKPKPVAGSAHKPNSKPKPAHKPPKPTKPTGAAVSGTQKGGPVENNYYGAAGGGSNIDAMEGEDGDTSAASSGGDYGSGGGGTFGGASNAGLGVSGGAGFGGNGGGNFGASFGGSFGTSAGIGGSGGGFGSLGASAGIGNPPTGNGFIFAAFRPRPINFGILGQGSGGAGGQGSVQGSFSSSINVSGGGSGFGNGGFGIGAMFG